MKYLMMVGIALLAGCGNDFSTVLSAQGVGGADGSDSPEDVGALSCAHIKVFTEQVVYARAIACVNENSVGRFELPTNLPPQVNDAQISAHIESDDDSGRCTLYIGKERLETSCNDGLRLRTRVGSDEFEKVSIRLGHRLGSEVR